MFIVTKLKKRLSQKENLKINVKNYIFAILRQPLFCLI